MASYNSAGIVRPRFLALDSSHLIAAARDKHSAEKVRQRSANRFEESLLDSGCIPLLCWHHVEELLKHRDERVVADRVGFIHALPMVAWIRDYTGAEGLGSVVDILAAEAAAALESPLANVVGIRDRTAEGLITFGTGAQAIGPYVNTWRELQLELWQREERTREIVAISRSTYVDNSKTKVVDLLKGKIRAPGDANHQLDALRKRLAEDIGVRGDKRIPDPWVVAANFLGEVRQAAAPMLSGMPNAVLHFLLQEDIEIADITPETTLGEICELSTFRKKLHVANMSLGVPWPRLKSKVIMDRIPSWVIQIGLNCHGHDLAERKGSELIDTYLACLSAYADITYVDKRTKENFRRARGKSPEFASVVRRVEKASRYSEIAQHILC